VGAGAAHRLLLRCGLQHSGIPRFGDHLLDGFLGDHLVKQRAEFLLDVEDTFVGRAGQGQDLFAPWGQRVDGVGDFREETFAAADGGDDPVDAVVLVQSGQEPVDERER